MITSVIRELFLQLIRSGIGTLEDANISTDIDWQQLKVLANEQGLTAVILDGLDRCDPQITGCMPKKMQLEWIGEVLKGEAKYASQKATAERMAALFSKNYLRTYVLKGEIVAECYPKPEHRVSVDVDCFLVADGNFDAWSFGNDLIKSKGYRVDEDYYKNSTFCLSGLTVENHRYLTPFRGNQRLKQLERLLQSWIHEDSELQRFEGTWLYKPPVMVSALFLIEHAYSHFLHEGLTWRLVLDWMMFSRKHKNEICWEELDARIDEFGFRKFYTSYYRLGQYLVGEINDCDLSRQDKLMLEDIWAPLDLHETVKGWRGKLALAGNTWRARWKYHYFSDLSWISALWIQAKGVLFEKDVVLE